MNVGIGAEAALFPEKEYINGIFVAVYATRFMVENLYNACIPKRKQRLSLRALQTIFDFYIPKNIVSGIMKFCRGVQF